MTEITYPVYLLGGEKPATIGDVSIVVRQYIIDGEEQPAKYYLVDDKSVPGSTLGRRRLALKERGLRLKTLGKAIFFLGDLVKLATPKLWFIDSSGKIFRYIKHKVVPLIFKRIITQHNIPTGGAIIELEGVPTRFKCLYAPSSTERYAGVLKIGLQYILYGVYDTLHNNTRRKI